MMKSLIVVFALLGVSQAAIMTSCWTGATADVVKKTDCTGTPSFCQMPTFVAYTGYTSDAEWKCGSCVDGAGAALSNCDKCDDPTADCNAVVETKTFECSKWSYKEDTWTEADDKTTCTYKTEGGSVMCNAPDRKTADGTTYTISLDGCGPCGTPSQKTAKTCLECDSDKCNGSAALSVSAILAVISFLYMM